jgi:hypothetical protein
MDSGLILEISATLVNECGRSDPYRDWKTYYNLVISYTVFFHISQFLLLVVFVWGINSLLNNHLGNRPSSLKMIYGVVLTITALLLVVYTGLLCYVYYRHSHYSDGFGYWSGLTSARNIIGLVYWILYILIVIASGTLSIMGLLRLRKRQNVARVSSPRPFRFAISAPLSHDQPLT